MFYKSQMVSRVIVRAASVAKPKSQCYKSQSRCYKSHELAQASFLWGTVFLRWAMWPMGLLFNSPEQVSFSDHFSSTSVCPSAFPSVCKLFTFSSSSPEPLGQFQPNFAQSIIWWRGFKFVQLKGHSLPKGAMIVK